MTHGAIGQEFEKYKDIINQYDRWKHHTFVVLLLLSLAPFVFSALISYLITKHPLVWIAIFLLFIVALLLFIVVGNGYKKLEVPRLAAEKFLEQFIQWLTDIGVFEDGSVVPESSDDLYIVRRLIFLSWQVLDSEKTLERVRLDKNKTEDHLLAQINLLKKQRGKVSRLWTLVGETELVQSFTTRDIFEKAKSLDLTLGS